MSSLVLPSTIVLQTLYSKCPARQSQLQQLSVFYNSHLPSPPILLVTGPEATGKQRTIEALLEANEIQHVFVRGRECLSLRHLVVKIWSGCLRSLQRNSNGTDESQEEDKGEDAYKNGHGYQRPDSLNALLVNLEELFRGKDKFVLILDSIESRPWTITSHTLLPALATLSDSIPSLSIVFITRSDRPLPLHRAGVPRVVFAPYTRSEMISIVTAKATEGVETPLQPERLPEGFPTVATSTLVGIYEDFVAAVYDTLVGHTSNSLPAFERVVERLWPRFVWPLIVGEAMSGKASGKRINESGNVISNATTTWDFPRLLFRNRGLFQIEGEKALVENLDADSSQPWTFNQLLQQHKEQDLNSGSQTTIPQLLPQSKPSNSIQQPPTILKFFSTLLLLSSYLASHTQAKHDIILFSRLSSSSSHKRRYLSSTLNRSKIRKTPTKAKTSKGDDHPFSGTDESPTKKRSKVVNAQQSQGFDQEKEKTHRSSRLLFEKTSSIPKLFSLERVVAILRAVHPDGLAKGKGTADRVYGEMVELERLRLVDREGGGRSADDGVLEEKWRCSVGREIVVAFGKRFDIGIEGWEID